MPETITIWLPHTIRAKLPALMEKYSVETNSMLVRKVLQEAIDFHLPDIPIGEPVKSPIGEPKGVSEPPIGIQLRSGTHLDPDKLQHPDMCEEHHVIKQWDANNELWICIKCIE